MDETQKSIFLGHIIYKTSIMGDLRSVPGQPGSGSPPGHQYHGQIKHPQVVQIQCCRYGRAGMAPHWSGGVIPGRPCGLQ